MANEIVRRLVRAAAQIKPDAAQTLTEKSLTQLEKRIGRIYAQATQEIQQTIDSYWHDLEEREAEMRKQLKAGEITPDYYRLWMQNQIGRGQRYEAMRDDLAERIYNVNEVANAYINDSTAGIYSLNRNYIGYTIEGYSPNIAWTIYDEQTVKRLVMEQPALMPYYPEQRAIKRGIDLAYSSKVIGNTITSAILQGRTIKQISRTLEEKIIDMGRVSSVRAARTAYTGAQNAGRLAGMQQARQQGIDVMKQWIATKDNRTRDSHMMMFGEVRNVNERFSNGCMYPGDRDGAPAEVYNCRCSMLYVVDGKSVIDNSTGADFRKWLQAAERRQING